MLCRREASTTTLLLPALAAADFFHELDKGRVLGHKVEFLALTILVLVLTVAPESFTHNCDEHVEDYDLTDEDGQEPDEVDEDVLEVHELFLRLWEGLVTAMQVS